MVTRWTLEDIGKIAGVSRSTVSRVINNKDGVKTEVRERVLAVIAETGYEPNPIARSLAGYRTGIMSLVIPETAETLFTDPYFTHLIQGVAQACNTQGYTLSLFLFHTAEDEERLTPRVLNSQLFDGLIVTATYIDDPLVEQLLEKDVPFVQIGSHRNPNVSTVDADNFNGAYNATTHLSNLGYQRIAAITGPQRNVAAIERKQGYLQGLKDSGMAIIDELIMEGDYSEQSGFDAMFELFDVSPDAVFAASDSMAKGAMRTLQSLNRQIPNEIAIVGFDDLPSSRISTPPLTTVKQPIEESGMMAVETLLDIIENGNKPARHVVLPTELIIRDSCGASVKT